MRLTLVPWTATGLRPAISPAISNAPANMASLSANTRLERIYLTDYKVQMIKSVGCICTTERFVVSLTKLSLNLSYGQKLVLWDHSELELDHMNLISSSSSPSGRWCQVVRNSSTRKTDNIKQHRCGFCLQVTTCLAEVQLKQRENKTMSRLITWPVRCSWPHQRTSSWRSEPTRSPGWRTWRRVNHMMCQETRK